MNITVTVQEKCKRQVRLEIPAETVLAETDRIASDLARRINIPGFRRGHVPRSVVKTRFRKELRDEVVSHLLPHALSDAVREKELKLVGEPSVDELKFGDDESIDVTFSFEIAPEWELANYTNLPAIRTVYKVRDEDVEKAINQLREGQAELVPVEDREARLGDVASANITGVFAAQNTPPEGDAAEPETIEQQDAQVHLGEQGSLKEFTEALLGTRVGDVRTLSIDYPADYSGKRFAGRHVDYTAEVTAIGVKELPEADDEFAKVVDENFKGIDELRADIRVRLERQAAQKSDAGLRAALLDQLVDRNRFDVPEVIVEKQLDSRINSLFRRLSAQGLDPRTMKLDWEDLRESQREGVEREVRASFVLSRIAAARKDEPSEEEVDREIDQLAEATGQTAAAVKARLTKEGTVDSIKEQIRNRKALDYVIASADVRNVEVEGLGDDGPSKGDQPAS
ncbi:MAG TPA: trigger factor [Blastocatellia bacterium]|nr:trigger factor [Blastocatellia bacterium]